MAASELRPPVTAAYDHGVVVVGGGPAGCAAGVFAARYGLETVIFDRGRSSIQRCAVLENYLGFPAGIDIETLYGLCHDHAERAGCQIVPDNVTALTRADDGAGFRVERQDGDPVRARRVVAATRYGGEYMRGLGDDAAMFETREHDGETVESFDRSYPNHDGTTPVPDLYVASPSEESQQAIVAAGRGARVAQEVVMDSRLDDGWWERAVPNVDWVRREAELDDEWRDRERWVEWFDDRNAGAAPVDPDSDRFERVRERVVDAREECYIEPEEIDARADGAHETLATHLDAEAIVAGCDERALLAAMDDDAIEAYAGERLDAGTPSS